MNNQRYNDYYLVNDEDMDIEDSIEFRPRKKCRPKKILCISSNVLISLLCLAFIGVFVVFPLVFMDNVSIQQDLVFTRWNLVSSKTYYNLFRFPVKNHYIPVLDLDNQTTLNLGLWHILPLDLAQIAVQDKSYDYDDALKTSNYSVLLYFHGTGEDRSQSQRKYQLLRYFFHVIAFDYRSYGDSDKGEMFEANVVNDCVQVYKWLRNRTDSPIYVWGHSLGTSLATSTLAHIGEDANVSGLVLEAAFTSFKDELYHHPYVKYFKWLPWFESTVVKPLERNGFIFNTSKSILNISSPIMFFHAEDDEIVPFYMSETLYNISQQRHVEEIIKNDTTLVLFSEKLRLNHYFIYQDPYVVFFIYEFLKRCEKDSKIFFEGSHQS